MPSRRGRMALDLSTAQHLADEHRTSDAARSGLIDYPIVGALCQTRLPLAMTVAASQAANRLQRFIDVLIPVHSIITSQINREVLDRPRLSAGGSRMAAWCGTAVTPRPSLVPR